MEIAYSILCTFYLLQNDCRQKSQNRPTAGKPPICHPFQDMKGNLPAKHGRIGHCDRSIEAGWVEKLLGIHRSLKQICRHTPLVAFNASPQQATEAYRKRRSAVCHHEKSCCMEICQKSWLSISSWSLITAFSVSSSALREDLQMASTKRRLRCQNPSCPSADTCEFLGPGTQWDPGPMAVVRNTSATHRKS